MNKRFENLKSVSDIVDTMIKGLRHEWVKIDMGSFGHVEVKEYLWGVVKKRTCVGCAATNFLCEVMQEPFMSQDIISPYERAEKVNFGITRSDLGMLETGIDALREGRIIGFHIVLESIESLFSFKIPPCSEITPAFMLPVLTTSDWEKNIGDYEKYRDWLRAKGL